MADLPDLCRAAVETARGGEAVEAFAQESRRTEVKVRGREVETLSVAETRGVGVRVIADGRLGYAYAADPTPAEVADVVARARASAAFAAPDEFHGLPAAAPVEPLPGLFREALAALPADRRVALALDLEGAATGADPRVRKVEEAAYGDSVSRVAVASSTGIALEYAATHCWCAVSALAEEGEETQTGFSFRVARDADELAWSECAAEAAARAAGLLGAGKPATARVPVVLDPHAAMAFLGVLAGALSAEAVQKGRSRFATMVGEPVASDLFTLVDDGRLILGPGAAPFDDEGVPTGRTVLIERGTLTTFLHNTYTARRGGTVSTGNAGRAGYRTPPGVSPTNLFVEPGDLDAAALLARAEGGVYVLEVSGVHSGASPISGEFSVGATGHRISGGAPGAPLREMTIASTLPEMLRAVAGVGSDLRFVSSVGSPSILVGEMTVGGT